MLSLLEKIKGINFKRISQLTSIPAPSFGVAMEERDLLSEPILFTTSDNYSPSSVSLVLQEEIKSSAQAEISFQAFVKNKFRSLNPENDFIFFNNDCYMDSIKLDIDPANCSKKTVASHIQMNLDHIPFDVEEIVITASIYTYNEGDQDYTFRSLPQTNLFIRDNETNNILNNINLTAEFPNCSGIIIGSLVRGYVIRENCEWAFISCKKGVKTIFSEPIRYFFSPIEVIQ